MESWPKSWRQHPKSKESLTTADRGSLIARVDPSWQNKNVKQVQKVRSVEFMQDVHF